MAKMEINGTPGENVAVFIDHGIWGTTHTEGTIGSDGVATIEVPNHTTVNIYVDHEEVAHGVPTKE